MWQIVKNFVHKPQTPIECRYLVFGLAYLALRVLVVYQVGRVAELYEIIPGAFRTTFDYVLWAFIAGHVLGQVQRMPWWKARELLTDENGKPLV